MLINRLLAVAAICTSSLLSAQTPEVSWLRFPSISPDGSTVAFAYQGDIFTVPMSGGAAKQITLHEAYESHPVWSRDGKSIAFASMRYGNDDVFTVSAEGGVPQRLTFHSAGDIPQCFSPDGSKVLFSSSRLDAQSAILFPSGVLPELYEMSVSGGRERQILTTPAMDVIFNKAGDLMAFHDQKGYEDDLRKHHTSSVARDIWTYNTASKAFTQITTWEGEDRNPVFYAPDKIYFLSERSGSFNVWKADITDGKEQNAQQVSFFEKHPVRELSIAENGMIVFVFNGDLYTQLPPAEPVKVEVMVKRDRRYNDVTVELISGDCSEFLLSPNEKEIAFIVRGEVFITSIEFNDTKRITNTPEQERDLAFNSAGTKLMYSSERNQSWNIYEAALGRKEEKYFYNSTLIAEKALVETTAETFQATYSPDDKEIAFLENRTTLRVKNLASGATRTVLPGNLNYSYSDGDQYYTWAPDSKWLLIEFNDQNRWVSQVGLVKASGEEPPINLSQSGYNNNRPKFGMDGKMIYWMSDKDGFRSHGSWGSQSDVFALFLTIDAYKQFTLDKADYAYWKEQKEEKDKEKEKSKDDSKGKDKDKKDEDDKKKEPVKPIEIDWEGLQDRKLKLTIFSSFLADFVLSKDAETLYYLASTGEEVNLWQTKFREKETKILAEVKGNYSALNIDKESKFIYLENAGNLHKVDLSDGAVKGIAFSSEMLLNTDAERRYMFEHAWRQFRDKFYLVDIHGADWQYYHDNYAQFLPHINNGYDFADLLSEMLGEANASHTGAFYRDNMPTGDATASLGIFTDPDYTGAGIRILELLPKSPLLNEGKKVSNGVIIEKIDGQPIPAGINYWPLLNRKADKKVLISYFNPANNKRWDEVVEPITRGAENQLLYERWVNTREAETKRLSDGKIGYVHVRGMDSESFREVYSNALGKYNACDALVVDTRFNGGGWLHDDLATFLSGEAYMQFVPRGQENLGAEPIAKWQKPSAVIMSESNYSDAHLFPYTYKFFNIGKLVGMPVPGTGTAVWWESMIDGTVFGIPQLGMRDTKTGKLMENLQLEPDIRVFNEPAKSGQGTDQQLEAAVKHLLEITAR